MQDQDEPKVKQKAIISAVCWVSRGHAKPVLDEYEPSAD